MASNEKFCLRWNDFETNISSAFQEIREEKEFFDQYAGGLRVQTYEHYRKNISNKRTPLMNFY